MAVASCDELLARDIEVAAEGRGGVLGDGEEDRLPDDCSRGGIYAHEELCRGC